LKKPNHGGVPRKAGGVKQQGQGVPCEARLGRKAEIWHGVPVPGGTTVPLSKTCHGDTKPSGTTVPLYLH